MYNDNTSDRERIEMIMEAEGLIASQFANEIGIKSPTLSHILNDRNNPSLEVMKKILDRYKNISPEWLISGQGDMYKEKTENKHHSLFDNDTAISYDIDTYDTKKRVEKEMQTTEKEKISSSYTESQQNRQMAQAVFVNTPQKKEAKKIVKIITYFDDGTFEEFFPTKS